jgi:hypothetical protein
MLKTRECKIQYKDNFKFKNTSLFTKLLIKKSKHFKKINLLINNVEFKQSSEDKDYHIFDISSIRDICRQSLGYDKYENDLIRIETTFTYENLKAINFYTGLSLEILRNSIFSQDLEIHFKPLTTKSPSDIGDIIMIEEYVVSDIQK